MEFRRTANKTYELKSSREPPHSMGNTSEQIGMGVENERSIFKQTAGWSVLCTQEKKERNIYMQTHYIVVDKVLSRP